VENTVRESLLTRFTEAVGDRALVSIFNTLYQSGTFKIIVLLSGLSAIIALGLAIHSKRPAKFPISFMLALAMLAPVSGKPAGFILADSFAKLAAAIIDKGVMSFAADSEDPNSAANMHPGLVMDMFTAAATSEFKNPATRQLFHQFLAKCMDNALTKTGEPAKYDDLFNFTTRYQTSGDSVVMTFDDGKLDSRSLANDDSIAEVQPGLNCDTALKQIRSQMVQDLEEQPFVVNHRIVSGAGSGDEDKVKSTDRWFGNWRNSGSPFLNVARNVRLGIASQYEKSHLINKLGWDNHWFGEYYKSTNMDPSLREMMLSLDSSVVDAGFQAANIKELPARLSGNRWAFSLGAEMKELKEKLELMPYYIAVLKNILKLICPFFVLILLTGRVQYFAMWAGSWIAVSTSASVVTAMRSVHNSIILSKLGIQDLTNEMVGNKILAGMVNVDQTKALMEDYIPLAYAMMKQEMFIIGGLASLIIGGSWMAGMVGNGIVGWIGSSITGQVMGNALSAGMGAVGKTINSFSAGFPRSDSNGGLRSENGNSEAMSKGLSFSKMFPRK
jgi:hypothetical protein